jgi:hypothetical protein
VDGHSGKIGFIWLVANLLGGGGYKTSEHGKVILPFRLGWCRQSSGVA